MQKSVKKQRKFFTEASFKAVSADWNFSGCVSLSNVSLPLHVRVITDSFHECDTLKKEWARNGCCPYCGTKLKKGFFKKTCKRCGIKF